MRFQKISQLDIFTFFGMINFSINRSKFLSWEEDYHDFTLENQKSCPNVEIPGMTVRKLWTHSKLFLRSLLQMKLK